VLNALPKSVQPAARRALAEIRDAEDKAHAEAAIKAFADEFEAKWPKAVAKITDKPDALLAFYDMPAEHWIHLKTTNPIESTFATVRLRTKVTKGAGSRSAGLAMAYKLIATAESRWRAVNAPHLVALVRAGALFHNGVLVERSEEVAGVNSVRNDTETMACAVCGTAFRRSGRPAPLLGGLPSGCLAPPQPGAERADRRQGRHRLPVPDV